MENLRHLSKKRSRMNLNGSEAINDTSTKARPVFICLKASDLAWDDSHEVDLPQLGLVVVGLLSSLIIILLNSIAIIAFKHRKELQKNSYILLSSLAVTDLLIGATFILTWVIVDLRDTLQVSVERLCTLLAINTNLMACLLFSSLHHLTAIAWERYVAIRKYVEYKIIVTKGRIKRLAMVAWLAAIVTTFPVLIMELMGIDSKVLKTWIIVGNVCGAISFLVIVYFYIMVCLGIHKRKTGDFSQVTALVNAKIQSKVTKTTALITAALFFTIIVAGVLVSLRIILPAFRTNFILQIVGTLFQLNSVLNPLVYFYRDRLFRKAVLELLRIKKPRPIQARDGAQQFRRRQDMFRSMGNIQQEMKLHESPSRSRPTRSASFDLHVRSRDEMILKRAKSARAFVNYSNDLDGLRMAKPSTVIVIAAEVHVERNVRYEAKEITHESPTYLRRKSARSNSWDATSSEIFQLKVLSKTARHSSQ